MGTPASGLTARVVLPAGKCSAVSGVAARTEAAVRSCSGRPRQDDDLDVGVVRHGLDRFVERQDELTVEGVAAVGSVQGDRPDAIGDLGEDDRFEVGSVLDHGRLRLASLG